MPTESYLLVASRGSLNSDRKVSTQRGSSAGTCFLFSLATVLLFVNYSKKTNINKNGTDLKVERAHWGWLEGEPKRL